MTGFYAELAQQVPDYRPGSFASALQCSLSLEHTVVVTSIVVCRTKPKVMQETSDRLVRLRQKMGARRT